MNNPLRRKQIAKAYLETLAMAGDYALEDSRLMGFVGELVKPPPNLGEHGSVKDMLKTAHYIRRAEPSKLDPDLVEWVLTELGRNYLASL